MSWYSVEEKTPSHVTTIDAYLLLLVVSSFVVVTVVNLTFFRRVSNLQNDINGLLFEAKIAERCSPHPNQPRDATVASKCTLCPIHSRAYSDGYLLPVLYVSMLILINLPSILFILFPNTYPKSRTPDTLRFHFGFHLHTYSCNVFTVKATEQDWLTVGRHTNMEIHQDIQRASLHNEHRPCRACPHFRIGFYILGLILRLSLISLIPHLFLRYLASIRLWITCVSVKTESAQKHRQTG